MASRPPPRPQRRSAREVYQGRTSTHLLWSTGGLTHTHRSRMRTCTYSMTVVGRTNTRVAKRNLLPLQSQNPLLPHTRRALRRVPAREHQLPQTTPTRIMNVRSSVSIFGFCPHCMLIVWSVAQRRRPVGHLTLPRLRSRASSQSSPRYVRIVTDVGVSPT